MKIEQSTTKTLQITRIPREGIAEHFIHGSCAAAISETEVFEELFKYLSSHDAQPVLFRVFASEPIRQQLLHQHAQSLGQLACPVAWISQDSSPQHQTFGIQAHAFSGRAVEAVMYQDTCVGCRYTDDGADYLQLSFLPSDRATDNVSQARAVFEKCRQILRASPPVLSSLLKILITDPRASHLKIMMMIPRVSPLKILMTNLSVSPFMSPPLLMTKI